MLRGALLTSALLLLLVLSAQSRAESWLELQLIPVSAQVNVLETEHVGSGGRVTFHFNRFIGVYVGGLYNWHNNASAFLYPSSFRAEVVDLPTPALATWQTHAGVESIPLIGTFAIGNREGAVGLVVSVGLGPGGSRVLLPFSERSYADTGVRLMGHFGIGMRFAIGAFALHAGVHTSMWSNLLTQLNGCSLDDVRAMDLAIRAGTDPSSASVAAECRGFRSSNDVPRAMNALRFSEPAIRVNVAAELALSWSL